MDAAPADGQLLHNLVLFGRLLRRLGLDVNPGRMIDVIQALQHVDLRRRDDFYHALRCLLVRRREDFERFDRAFALFWRKPSEAGAPFAFEPGARAPAAQSRQLAPLRDAGPRPAGSGRGAQPDMQPPAMRLTATYSDREVLRRKDFSDLTRDEFEAIRQMMRDLAWRAGVRRTRRRRPGRGPRLDLRRTVRANLRYGSEVLEWARLEPKLKPRPLVLLADISGSMERYTRVLLHFIYGLTAGLDQPVESFVFGTRLTRITRPLRDRDVDRALRHVSQAVRDWSGGTRIGEALKTFNFDWGRRVLGRGAVVLLISDGWDRGDVDLLRREMARLHRSCQRLIWLNPLLGSPDYEPLTRGMQAALPHVDDFLPVHNLASLEDLLGRLAGL